MGKRAMSFKQERCMRRLTQLGRTHHAHEYSARFWGALRRPGRGEAPSGDN
jgi:hypothetical protein